MIITNLSSLECGVLLRALDYVNHAERRSRGKHRTERLECVAEIRRAIRRAPVVLELDVDVEIADEDVDTSEAFGPSDDPAADAEMSRTIRERLGRGDLWAWCSVRVVVRRTDAPRSAILGASSWLGACSYLDEDDFRSSAYFVDMLREAIDSIGASS